MVIVNLLLLLSNTWNSYMLIHEIFFSLKISLILHQSNKTQRFERLKEKP